MSVLYSFLVSYYNTLPAFSVMAGLGYIPLKDVVVTLSIQLFLIAINVVFTVIAIGFVVSRFMNIYPIEAAIISACQSGMGVTGDVAILSTANRMNLMPFAQVATRLCGKITVIVMTGIFRRALDAKSRKITIEMQIAAAKGFASLIPDSELSTTNIIPDAFQDGVATVVVKAVSGSVYD